MSCIESPPGPHVVIDGEQFLYFGGTGYLGLANHPDVISAGCEASRQYGVHSATSRGGVGTSPIVQRVETLASRFFGTEDSVYTLTGYFSAELLVRALAPAFEVVLVDEASHYSVFDAAEHSRKPLVRFGHRDLADLALRLKTVRAGHRPLVMTDGVFAASGAVAPLTGYLELLAKFPSAMLLVDDAHGFGALGSRGRGTLDYLELWSGAINDIPAARGVSIYVGGTCSKGLGGFGGILPGTKAFLDRVRASSPLFIATSAPPSCAAGSTAKALEILLVDPAPRDKLHGNVQWLRSRLEALGVELEDSPAAQVSFVVGDAENMKRIHAALSANRIFVPYIASYAGVASQGLLRIAVSASHDTAALQQLVSALDGLIGK